MKTEYHYLKSESLAVQPVMIVGWNLFPWRSRARAASFEAAVSCKPPNGKLYDLSTSKWPQIAFHETSINNLEIREFPEKIHVCQPVCHAKKKPVHRCSITNANANERLLGFWDHDKAILRNCIFGIKVQVLVGFTSFWENGVIMNCPAVQFVV